MNLNAIKSSESASFKKLNPHLFGTVPPAMIASFVNAKPKTKKRIRQSDKPLLNKLESEFFEVLKGWNPNAQSSQITAQAIRFSLGNGIAYKPDFVIFRIADCAQAYECKGPHSFRGGFENLKVAAHKYPCVDFFLVWKDEQGQWQEQHVLP